MPVDAERGPAVELRLDGAARAARHQAERVAAQVDQRPAALARQLEFAPQRSELVVGVERAGAGKPEILAGPRLLRWHHGAQA
jgi:hypothetical protein